MAKDANMNLLRLPNPEYYAKSLEGEGVNLAAKFEIIMPNQWQ